MDVEEKKKPQPPKKPLLFWYAIILVALMVINLFITPAIAEKSIKQVSYDKFLEDLDDGKIKEVNLESDTIYYSLESEDKNGIIQFSVFPCIGRKNGTKIYRKLN